MPSISAMEKRASRSERHNSTQGMPASIHRAVSTQVVLVLGHADRNTSVSVQVAPESLSRQSRSPFTVFLVAIVLQPQITPAAAAIRQKLEFRDSIDQHIVEEDLGECLCAGTVEAARRRIKLLVGEGGQSGVSNRIRNRHSSGRVGSTLFLYHRYNAMICPIPSIRSARPLRAASSSTRGTVRSSGPGYDKTPLHRTRSGSAPQPAPHLAHASSVLRCLMLQGCNLVHRRTRGDSDSGHDVAQRIPRFCSN
jgi:hypothetical protein